jgi:hypothetical protein
MGIGDIEKGNAKCTTKSVINKDFAVSAIPSFGGKPAAVLRCKGWLYFKQPIN